MNPHRRLVHATKQLVAYLMVTTVNDTRLGKCFEMTMKLSSSGNLIKNSKTKTKKIFIFYQTELDNFVYAYTPLLTWFLLLY